jgi:putative endonuclease
MRFRYYSNARWSSLVARRAHNPAKRDRWFKFRSASSISSMSRVSGKPYFVYILWSEVGRRFYIGISEDIAHRLSAHNQSRSRWSARYVPWTMVYQEAHSDYRSARLRENELKRQKGGEGFFRLTGLDRSQFPRPI